MMIVLAPKDTPREAMRTIVGGYSGCVATCVPSIFG